VFKGELSLQVIALSNSGVLSDLTNSLLDTLIRHVSTTRLQMVKYFDIDQSLVAISAYYQDRFLGTKEGEAARSDRVLYRLVSVTCLYICIKLRIPHRWNVTSHAFSQMCRGTVTGEEINNMELKILFALGESVSSFVRNLDSI